MRDITEDFVQAKKIGLLTLPELTEVIDVISGLFPKCVLDWDREAGEEWARFCGSNGIICMIHTKLKIVSSTLEIPHIKAVLILVDNFYEPIWSINLNEIRCKCPELCWKACAEAVNSQCFNLHDLYYATV